MTKDDAEELSLLILGASRLLDQSTALVKDADSVDFFKDYKRNIGKTMGALHADILDPIWERFPELRPTQMDGPYEPDTSLAQQTKKCSFCKLPEEKVGTLIQGPRVWICNSCVELCGQILEESISYYPVNDSTVDIQLPKDVTTIGKLRKALSQHHFNTKVRITLSGTHHE